MKALLIALPALIALGASAVAQAVTAARGDRELGQYLSSECVACHQATGRQTGGVPAITGWPDDQFIAVMQAYKNRDRDNEIMRTIAARLSSEEIEALASYFGSLRTR